MFILYRSILGRNACAVPMWFRCRVNMKMQDRISEIWMFDWE
jgi:hypothetical protein